MKPLYVAVTRDKYRLPVAVEDSVADLARSTGRSVQSVCHSLCRANQNGKETGTVVKVWITDAEWREIQRAECADFLWEMREK